MRTRAHARVGVESGPPSVSEMPSRAVDNGEDEGQLVTTTTTAAPTTPPPEDVPPVTIPSQLVEQQTEELDRDRQPEAGEGVPEKALNEAERAVEGTTTTVVPIAADVESPSPTPYVTVDIVSTSTFSPPDTEGPSW
ncbi:unnamed protein product [Vitrella brassicaformis CCMP3155]|uniref:Uncharacterized protein n=1 Tax=Vitrella brassicaformis (strain CCMP3155) TaxID=1169540 RepID=A0A0G4GP34_VITBC|nr:unnamed protein product [Vitrella brassicaformis CCMP3155]|eukprot:CEM32071.1 unnamed protein product [Vitrella brassicaformis CCMP3155]